VKDNQVSDDGIVRLIALLATGAALGALTSVPTAHAADPGPLYRLVDTASQRLLTADPVAAFKWVDGGSIEDPARVGQVLDNVAADARDRGVDEDFVRRAFQNQIHATEGIQYVRFGQWKLDPAAAPTSAPNLSESRTAIDGFNRTMVSEMAAQSGVLHGPGCTTALDAARQSVIADRGLDPLYQQALDFATHTYCG
jgi:chorismate mutase